jgi:hypothetical protein
MFDDIEEKAKSFVEIKDHQGEVNQRTKRRKQFFDESRYGTDRVHVKTFGFDFSYLVARSCIVSLLDFARD